MADVRSNRFESTESWDVVLVTVTTGLVAFWIVTDLAVDFPVGARARAVLTTRALIALYVFGGLVAGSRLASFVGLAAYACECWLALTFVRRVRDVDIGACMWLTLTGAMAFSLLLHSLNQEFGAPRARRSPVVVRYATALDIVFVAAVAVIAIGWMRG